MIGSRESCSSSKHQIILIAKYLKHNRSMFILCVPELDQTLALTPLWKSHKLALVSDSMNALYCSYPELDFHSPTRTSRAALDLWTIEWFIQFTLLPRWTAFIWWFPRYFSFSVFCFLRTCSLDLVEVFLDSDHADRAHMCFNEMVLLSAAFSDVGRWFLEFQILL